MPTALTSKRRSAKSNKNKKTTTSAKVANGPLPASPAIRSKRKTPEPTKKKRKKPKKKIVSKEQEQQEESVLDFHVEEEEEEEVSSSTQLSSSEEEEEVEKSPPKRRKRTTTTTTTTTSKARRSKPQKKQSVAAKSVSEVDDSALDYSSDAVLADLPEPDDLDAADFTALGDVSGIYSPVLEQPHSAPPTERKQRRRSRRQEATTTEIEEMPAMDLDSDEAAPERESASSSGEESKSESPNTLVFNELNANMQLREMETKKQKPRRALKPVKITDESLNEEEKQKTMELQEYWEKIDAQSMEDVFVIE